MEKEQKKELDIDADDFGLHSDFDEGILAVASAGRISSVSVLIKGPSLSYYNIDELKKSGVRIGLHLDFGKYDPANPCTQDCKTKFLEQFDKFQELFGFVPRHLDGHYRAYLENLELFELTVAVAKQYNLYVRGRGEYIQKLKERGVKTCDNFLDGMKHPLAELIPQAINGLNELMTHPGHVHKKTNYQTALIDKRQEDLDFLLSDVLEKLLKENSIQLVNFKNSGAGI